MDISYLLFLQNLRESLGGIFDCLMSQITTLCESQVSFLLLAAVYWCVDKHAGELMCLNTSFGMIINHIIKNLCCIERPWVRDSRVKPVEAAVPAATGYSFPSGHTASVTAVYGSLGTSLWRKKSRAAAAICWGVVAFVAFSRNYLGVHTPQDVLVSLAIGILLILVLNKILEWADKGKNRDIAVAAVGIAMCAASVIITGCLSSSAGIGAGLLLGWLLERRFVKFDTSGSFAQKCVRFALGAAGVW